MSLQANLSTTAAVVLMVATAGCGPTTRSSNVATSHTHVCQKVDCQQNNANEGSAASSELLSRTRHGASHELGTITTARPMDTRPPPVWSPPPRPGNPPH
jgi:hypothetical protein